MNQKTADKIEEHLKALVVLKLIETEPIKRNDLLARDLQEKWKYLLESYTK